MSREITETSSSRARRAQLKLLAPPARRPRPRYVPSKQLTRRPGERREPLSLDVSPALAAAAVRSGLDLRCAVELCLERALVIKDLAVLGYLHLYEPLPALAATVTVSRALPTAKARYLQVLLAARDRQDVALGATYRPANCVVDVPLRLFPRVFAVVTEIASVGDDQLAEALTLEIAATSEGRSMSEWAALAALRLSR